MKMHERIIFANKAKHAIAQNAPIFNERHSNTLMSFSKPKHHRERQRVHKFVLFARKISYRGGEKQIKNLYTTNVLYLGTAIVPRTHALIKFLFAFHMAM